MHTIYQTPTLPSFCTLHSSCQLGCFSPALSFPPLSSCFPLLHHSFLVQHLVNSLPLLWSLTLAEHICTSYAEWALIQKALSADTACLFFFTWLERLFVIWLLTSGLCFTASLSLALSQSSSVCLSWVCLSFSCVLKLGWIARKLSRTCPGHISHPQFNFKKQEIIVCSKGIGEFYLYCIASLISWVKHIFSQYK